MDFKEFFKKQNILVEEEVTKIKATIFPGRFQPPHIGHAKLIEKMKNDYPEAIPYMILIKGEKSSQNTEKNPFNVEDQAGFLEKVSPGINIEVFPSADLKNIIEKLAEKNIEVEAVYCGPDRVDSYAKALDAAGYHVPQYNKTPEQSEESKARDIERELAGEKTEKKVVNLVSVEDRFAPSAPLSPLFDGRELSATLVRDIILNSAYEDFLKVTRGFGPEDFKEMQKKVLDGKSKWISQVEKEKNEKEVDRIRKKLATLLAKADNPRTPNEELKYKAAKEATEKMLKLAEEKTKVSK